MARYTVAYSEFVKRTEEVLLLVKRARRLERSSQALSHGSEINALCRGAIVLLSSHVEAYVKELGECALDAIFERAVEREKLNERFFYYASHEWVGRIRDLRDPDSITTEVFQFLENDSEIWGKAGPLPRPIDSQVFSKGFQNPKFDKVKKFLGRFGYDGLRHHINITHQAEANLVISHLEQIVDTRNAIAHGETSATRTPSEVKVLVDFSKQFCRTVDDGFAGWFCTNICPIR